MAAANVVSPMLTPKNSQESEEQKNKNHYMNSEETIKVKFTKDQLKKKIIW